MPAGSTSQSRANRSPLAAVGLAALGPTGLDGPTKLEVIALVTGFVATFVTGEVAETTPSEQQVALIGQAVACCDFPHLAAALAAGAPVRETGFERLAGWVITGLVEQARLG